MGKGINTAGMEYIYQEYLNTEVTQTNILHDQTAFVQESLNTGATHTHILNKQNSIWSMLIKKSGNNSMCVNVLLKVMLYTCSCSECVYHTMPVTIDCN